jgi:hypothetical protein
MASAPVTLDPAARSTHKRAREYALLAIGLPARPEALHDPTQSDDAADEGTIIALLE